MPTNHTPSTHRNLTTSKKGAKESVIVLVDFKKNKEQPYILPLDNGNPS